MNGEDNNKEGISIKKIKVALEVLSLVFLLVTLTLLLFYTHVENVEEAMRGEGDEKIKSVISDVFELDEIKEASGGVSIKTENIDTLRNE